MVGLEQDSAPQNCAFRWTADASQYLGTLGFSLDTYSVAYAVSGDGKVTVGQSGAGFFSEAGSVLNFEAFRWIEETGMEGLGFLASSPGTPGPGNNVISSATDVSADGRTIVGWSESDNFQKEAFLWTEHGGMHGLGFEVTSPTILSRIGSVFVSGDGETVIGNVYDELFNRNLVRWTDHDGLEFLSDTTGMLLHGVTDDGSTAYGAFRESDLDQSSAAIWDEMLGLVIFQELLEARGLALSNLLLTSITGVSSDGLTFVGTSNNGGWLARLDPWVTVPEPSTFSLFLIALAVLWFSLASSRKRQKVHT